MSVLCGFTAVIVEDEAVVAMMAEDCLREFGMEVIGTVGTVEDALFIVENSPPDVAIVDLKLHGQSAVPLIFKLQAVGVACLVVTGYGKDAGATDFPNVPVLAKPYDVPTLRSVLEELLLNRHTAPYLPKNQPVA